MSKSASPADSIIAALPAVRDAIKRDIAERIAAGEAIARVEAGEVIATSPATRNLAKRRNELAGSLTGESRKKSATKSAA